MVRRNGSCPSTVYTLPDFSKVHEKKTIVPFTCDVMLAAAQKYIAQGVSAHNGSHTRVIRLVGDATHDESFQKLKVLKIGLAGCHFERGECKTTMILVNQCICHQVSFLAHEDICLGHAKHNAETHNNDGGSE